MILCKGGALMTYLKKIVSFMVTILLVSVITFFVFQVLPGNPAQIILGADADPLQVEALTHQMGLDRPLITRYFEWIQGVFHGNLGNSLRFDDSVATLIRHGLEVTGSLVAFTMLLTLLCGIPLSIFLARRSKGPAGALYSMLSQLGLAIPHFWLGMLLMLLFSVTLRWLPAGQYVRFSESPWGAVKSLVLPSVCLAVGNTAMMVRYLRNALVDELSAPYVRGALLKGLTFPQVMRRHVLRNALLPAVTVFGMILVDTLGGSIIVETVFSLPGIGSLIATSINSRDFPLIQGLVLYLSIMVVAVNFLVDLTYSLLDPRIRRR
ncbi:Dipeptide transport system permease protein DppB [Clostridiaceae bacterium JG1575]|nr:Dipeptide transport system permease protein DppB [Clostridiaceae bacterium JG1575]